MRGSAQAFLARSNRSVPEASVGSVAACPVSRRRSQSLGCSAHQAARTVHGSWVMSQESSGPAMPGDGRLPSTAVYSQGSSW